MDVFFVSKAFLVGIITAGSLYITTALAFHFFPMPIFLNLRRMLGDFARKQYKRKASRGKRIWSIGRSLLVIIMLLVWLGLIAGYLYFMHLTLPNYIPETDPIYWYYFAVATGLPTLLAIIQFFKFFRKKSVEEEYIPHQEEDTRPLLEQMEG